jgi:diaminopimelate decarboxylase
MKTVTAPTNFPMRRGVMHAEQVNLELLAEEVGTPCYVYSATTLRNNVRGFQKALAELNPLVCFAVKSNSNLSVLQLFAKEGTGFDIVSGGELHRVLRAGADAQRVIYSGVGKTRDEIEMAMSSRILMFNVESWPELEAIRAAARRQRRIANIALRVNPDVEVESHPYISTGAHHHKFGINFSEIPGLADRLRRAREIRWTGIACHIGSQITSLRPFEQAFARMADLYRTLRQSGVGLETIDLGGGLGVRYRNEKPPAVSGYARLLKKYMQPLGARLIVEPGRFLVGDAGLLLTRLLYVKSTRGKLFYIVDAGMNDLIRPTLYQAWHPIVPVHHRSGRRRKVDVVGPICETGDFLARDRNMPEMRQGELLAVLQAAAYGQAQASNYNARCRAAEILVEESSYRVVRRRESYDDMIRGEEL